MKKQLLILLYAISSLNGFAQPAVDCNNVTYYADTFYVSVSNNILSDTIYYNDTGIAYPTHCLYLLDTSLISATTTFSSDSCFIFTGLQQNSFDDTVHFGYQIIFHSTSFPNNTVVNGYFHLLKIEFNDTIIDCYFPVVIILQNPTGVGEVMENEMTKIYPNPAVNEISVLNNSNRLVQFSLYNSLGAKLVDKILTSKRSVIDLSSYPGGIYFAQMKNNSQYLHQKIIVQK